MKKMTGTLLKERQTGRHFQFRLIQQDSESRPDIWQSACGGKWVMIVARATPEEIQRYF